MSKKRFFGCIGNPPYQDDSTSDNQNNAVPLYHTMLDAASNIADRVEMITPARFLFNAGWTPKEWNEKMLNDEHLKVIDYEPNSAKVFPGTDIKGGVAVTYRDKTKTFTPIGIFTPYENLNNIIKKVQKKSTDNLSDIISQVGTYRYSSKAYDEHPEIMKLSPDARISSTAFDRMHEIFVTDIPDDGCEYIKIIGRANKHRAHRYIKREYLKDNSLLSKFSVALAKASGSGEFGETLSTPIINEPGVAFTMTYIAIGEVDTKNEAEAILKYIKSKFCRAMLCAMKVTQNNTRVAWKCVPLQDFTSTSDIDWTKPIPDIDRQLYEKYGLSDEEINFIEEKVKTME